MITENEFLLRKERMISSAYTLFCENGIASTSMMQIAKKANVSEISLYRYFGTKTALLSETQKILWENIVKETELTLFENKNYDSLSGLEQTKQLLSGFLSLINKHADYLVFANSYKSELIRVNCKVFPEDFNTIFDRPTRVLSEAIKKGQKDNSVKNTIDGDILAETIWNLARCYVEHIAIYDVLVDKNNSYRNRFDTVLELLNLSLIASAT